MGTDTAPDTPEQLPCAPCRGTGRVVSNLGGSAHELACPWCDGTGRFVPGHDAQAGRRGGAGDGDAPDSGTGDADELPIKSRADSSE